MRIVRKPLSVAFIAALLVAGLMVPAGANVGGDFGACGGTEWIKLNPDGTEDDRSGEAPDADITLSNWDFKQDEEDNYGEVIGFDWTSDTQVSSVHTKSGSNNPVNSSTSGTEGTVNTEAGDGEPAISHITFCFDEPAPETQTVSFTKSWDGDEFDDSDVVVTFDVEIDGDTVTLDDGEESDPFPADADYSFESENVTGFPDDECNYRAAVSGDEDGDYTVTNMVNCDDPEPTLQVEKELTGGNAPGNDTEFTVCLEHGPQPDTAGDATTAVAPSDCRGSEAFIGEGTISAADGHDFGDIPAGDYVLYEVIDGRDAFDDHTGVSFASDLELDEIADHEHEGVSFTVEDDSGAITIDVTNSYSSDSLSIPTTTPIAEVEVLKEWTVDGEDVTDEVEISPEFTVEISADGSSFSETIEAGEVADFSSGLSSGTEYDVTVTEVEASMPEAPFDEPVDGDDPGRECDLESVEYSPADATVTAGQTGNSVTITATNVYECTAVAPTVVAAVDVQVEKAWQVTDGDEVTGIDAPDDHTASFQVSLLDSDDVEVDDATVESDAETRFENLEDGESYTLAWDEVNAPEEFENAAGDTCTLNQDLSTTEGSVEFTAGVDAGVDLAATNVYDCEDTAVEGEVEEVAEVKEISEEALPETGANALWLTLLGMLGLGSGFALLTTRRKDGRQEV